MKKLLKPATLFPAVIGVAAGAVLFAIGYSEDAPGLCLLGFSLAFVLVMWGLSNAGVIKKGFLAPILLFCFGAGGIVLSIVLLLDGEFGKSPWLAIVGVVLGIILIALGSISMRNTLRKSR